jgi:phenylacetate-CoA ligase
MVVLDTAEDWQWWIDGWQFVLDAAEIGAQDRIVTAFSFGPFIGFWTAHDAAVARGALLAPSGGMSTRARLELIQSLRATAVFCTPSYALHMAEVAEENQLDVASLGVRRIVVAGEPGGSLPAVRSRIETAWRALVIDHSGATEVGPWGYADAARNGLHVNESEFIPEFLSIETGRPAGEGELSELVLTTLGRAGNPVVRYRTGDLVRPTWQAPGNNRFVLLEGGVLGRADDMMIIRGVNVFPSSIDQILRSFPEIVEYRLTARKLGQMDALTIEIEDRLNDPRRVATELQIRLGLHVEVRTAPLGSLPRSDDKGQRFVDTR